MTDVRVTTPHDNVLALDAATGELRWAFPYSPSYELQYAVNRGVGLGDGRIFIATQDCRIIAIDAATGKSAWNVPGCASTASTWYSSATYVYRDQVIVGTSGPAFGHAHLSVSQTGTIVTQQMPADAPGSLTPQQYASIMAYLMQYNCIAPSGGGKTPFPTTDGPAFKSIAINGETCPK